MFLEKETFRPTTKTRLREHFALQKVLHAGACLETQLSFVEEVLGKQQKEIKLETPVVISTFNASCEISEI